jgi:hypothetical protein
LLLLGLLRSPAGINPLATGPFFLSEEYYCRYRGCFQAKE